MFIQIINWLPQSDFKMPHHFWLLFAQVLQPPNLVSNIYLQQSHPSRYTYCTPLWGSSSALSLRIHTYCTFCKTYLQHNSFYSWSWSAVQIKPNATLHHSYSRKNLLVLLIKISITKVMHSQNTQKNRPKNRENLQ